MRRELFMEESSVMDKRDSGSESAERYQESEVLFKEIKDGTVR